MKTPVLIALAVVTAASVAGAAVLVRDRTVADFYADYAQRPEVSATRRHPAAKKSPPEGGD